MHDRYSRSSLSVTCAAYFRRTFPFFDPSGRLEVYAISDVVVQTQLDSISPRLFSHIGPACGGAPACRTILRLGM